VPERKSRSSPQEPDAPEAPAPFWSGTITFGLVSVPVNLYPAHREEQVRLRMLAPDGSPVARRYRCERDGRDLERDEIVRGFELTPGKHVVVTDDELARLAPQKSRDIELKRFVDADQLDPVLFDRPYVLTPGGSTAKSYRLLAKVMEDKGLAGIATFVMSGKERVVAIIAEHGILRAETVRFADEVRTPDDVGLPPKAKPDRDRVAGFAKAIDALAKPALAPAELADPYARGLRELVDALQKKKSRVVVRREKEAEPVDLVEVLKRSLKRGEASRHARAVTRRQTRPKRRASRS
jgi:DNA end-binding protein Ku